MSVRSDEPKYHPLYNQVGTGIRDFAKANEDWYDEKYAYMAINPFSLLPVKILSGGHFKYINPTDEQFPPIRFDKTQLPHYPRTTEDQNKFAGWFYKCLSKGRHLPPPEDYQPDKMCHTKRRRLIDFCAELEEKYVGPTIKKSNNTTNTSNMHSESEKSNDSESEELEDDLDGFIVPDDYIEYESD
jgi:hypothetical protein